MNRLLMSKMVLCHLIINGVILYDPSSWSWVLCLCPASILHRLVLLVRSATQMTCTGLLLHTYLDIDLGYINRCYAVGHSLQMHKCFNRLPQGSQCLAYLYCRVQKSCTRTNSEHNLDGQSLLSLPLQICLF